MSGLRELLPRFVGHRRPLLVVASVPLLRGLLRHSERRVMLGAVQFWLQGWPNKRRPWAVAWLGNRLSDLRFWLWRATGGPLREANGKAVPPSDLASVILVLEHRASKLSECLSAQLEADYPLTYERIYWLVCGVTDYLSRFKDDAGYYDACGCEDCERHRLAADAENGQPGSGA